MTAVPTAALAGRLVARSVWLDDQPDLIDSLPVPSGLLWSRRGEGLAAWGQAARVPVAAGPGRFPAAVEALAQVLACIDVRDEVRQPGSGPVAFGSFTFDPYASGSTLMIPQVVLGRRAGRAWLTVISDQAFAPRVEAVPVVDAGRVRYRGSSLPELAWLEAVDDAVARITAGEADKVVLARDRLVVAARPFDPRLLTRRLAARFPDCYTFASAGLVGATPELLVRRTGATVESVVLAGSAPRGADATDDARIGAALLASDKDRDEHVLAVESVRAVLQPMCAQLTVDASPHLLRLHNVTHLATGVTGRLDTPASALALAGRLHPTAAVGGAPTPAALHLIAALEGMGRARYSGPVGWVDARGDGEWGIALRCAELDGARARMFAGAGIVRESLPEAELEETRLKLRAMQSAFEGDVA